MQSAIKYAENAIQTNERYAKVRHEVEQWTPPSSNHNGIKEFALKQIDKCVVPERYIIEYQRQAQVVLDDSDDAVLVYIDNQIRQCEKNTSKGEKRLGK